MSSKHIHKLKRFISKNKRLNNYNDPVYFCVLDCKFKIKPPLALGKTSICWGCEKEFVMNEYSIRLARPKCISCTHGKNTKVEAHLDNYRNIDKSETVPALDLASRMSKITHGPISQPAIEDEDVEL